MGGVYSYRVIIAVWNDYDTLVEHWQEAKVDASRDKADYRTMFEGFLRNITNEAFTLDLELLCNDALENSSN